MAKVKCAICNADLQTEWRATGTAGHCRQCNIWWHDRCHTHRQCPRCKGQESCK